MEKDELSIEKLREDYSKFSGKYSLPNFDDISEDFDIEKILEKETNFLLREIRRAMNEKLSAYLNLFESFTSPSSPPIFVFALLKNANEDDRKKMREIYNRLAKIEINVLKLDIIYEEAKEAEFIKNIFDEWQSIKKEIREIIEKLEKDFSINHNASRRGYFG